VAVTSVWDRWPLTAPHLAGAFGFSAGIYFPDALWAEFGPDVKRFSQRLTNRLRKQHQAAVVDTGNPPRALAVSDETVGVSNEVSGQSSPK
jgi:hypothetical protein